MPKTDERTIVLEHMTVAGYPLAPVDKEFAGEPVPSDGDLGERIAAGFHRISARLIIPVGAGGRIVRADKVYDVHYWLLAGAALTDYEDPVVGYTAYGLIRNMGWTYGGRQVDLVRKCVDHLFGMAIEFEGEIPDRIVMGRKAHGMRQFRVIIDRFTPSKEERTSGRRGGRNLSWVEYNPNYLRHVAHNPGVKIDVEAMSQIRGAMPKAMYRLASWLRSRGEEQINLAEAFERVGSFRKRITPSDAWNAFGSCFEVMQRYRYIRHAPSIEPDGKGGYRVFFEWDEPIALPSRGDILHRELCSENVDARVAAKMVVTNKRRAARALMAYRMGVLPEPRETPAKLIVGVFNDPDWELPDLTKSAQLELLDHRRLTSRHSVRANPTATAADLNLSRDDLIGRVRSERNVAARAEWLGLLRAKYNIDPRVVGYDASGRPLAKRQ